MKITEAQVTAACQVAGEVFNGQLKTAQGVAALVAEHGLNEASAGDFIRDYNCLLSGKVFHRAMSAAAMRHFMEQIFADREEHHKENAVVSLRGHIAYYEKHYKTTMHAMRAVADDFDELLRTPRTALSIEAEFLAGVQRSLRSSQEDRLRRLATARKQPASVTVQSTVYIRNSDVAAETLVRAGGQCEACGSDAPFLRAKDRTPYLEVHHRVQLSAGGEDTVENTLALCPNCHRRTHYGAADA